MARGPQHPVEFRVSPVAAEYRADRRQGVGALGGLGIIPSLVADWPRSQVWIGREGPRSMGARRSGEGGGRAAGAPLGSGNRGIIRAR